MKLYLLAIVFLMLALIAGCGNSVPAEPQDNNPDDHICDHEHHEDEDCDENEDETSGSYLDELDDAASALPEPWMAFPGSGVEINFHTAGVTEHLAWLLITPKDIGKDAVEQYYKEMAEERDEFEIDDLSQGKWLWKGYEVWIELNPNHEDFPYFQYNFHLYK